MDWTIIYQSTTILAGSLLAIVVAIFVLASSLLGLAVEAASKEEEENRAKQEKLIAEQIAAQVRARFPYRRAVKQAIAGAMRGGALGIKVNVAGRLNGAEMARSESYKDGRIPLHTLRADIDYGFAESLTTYSSEENNAGNESETKESQESEDKDLFEQKQ